MYCNCSGGRKRKENAQQNTETVSGNTGISGAILFPALFSGKQYDSGYYSGNK